MLSLLALLLSTPAQATCTLAALETRIDRSDGGLLRRDRWTWRVEGGQADCARIDLASPEAAPILDRSARVERPDGRDPRVTAERWQAVARVQDPGFGPAPGLRLHLPELRTADLVVVETVRPWPEEHGFTWRPGARGALEIATLDAPTGLEVQVEGAQAEPEQTGGRRSWWLESVPAGQPEPFSTVVAAGPPAEAWTHVVALLLPERKPLLALGDDKKSRTLRRWEQRGGGEQLIALPLQAQSSWCTAGGQPCPVVGGVAWRVDPSHGATWGQVEHGSWIAGQVQVPPAEQATVAVLAPSAQLVLHHPWQRLDSGAAVGALVDQLLPDGLPVDGPLPDGGQLAVGVQAGTLSWRLRTLDGARVLADRTGAEQLVARLAVGASIPEPGLTSELKGRKEDASAVPEVIDALRQRVAVGSLPGQPDLAPRTLMKARRSGWGNPWEVALVLARYLGQLKLDALPVPVRPRELGPPDPASVEGWPQALVRVRVDGQELWVDPSCPPCAPGQLRPALDRAWALSPELDQLPALEPSSWLRRVDEEGAVELVLSGPLAVDLRARLLLVPPAERRAWLARTLVAPGAVLVEEQGLSSAGDQVHLWFEPVQGPLVPPLQAPSVQGSDRAFLVAAGHWVEERPLVGSGSPPAVHIETPGLQWSRGGSQGRWREELVVEQREVARGPAHTLLGTLEQTWGQQQSD